MVALFVATILVVTFVTPAKAEAEVMTTIALVTLIVAGAAIVLYLIIASTTGEHRVQERVLRVVCLGESCAGLLAHSPAIVSPAKLEAP